MCVCVLFLLLRNSFTSEYTPAVSGLPRHSHLKTNMSQVALHTICGLKYRALENRKQITIYSVDSQTSRRGWEGISLLVYLGILAMKNSRAEGN